MSDASPALVRAIVASAATSGCYVSVKTADAREWASATFVGQQHRLHLRVVPGTATMAWLAGLPEADWQMPGHLVAYVGAEGAEAGDAADNSVIVTALTIQQS